MPIDLRQLLRGQALTGGRPLEAEDRWPVAVLTMEIQRGVMGDLASFPELAQAATEAGLVANTARLLGAVRARGLGVVHCTAEFRPDRLGTIVNTPLHAAVARLPGHLLVGSAEVEVCPELGPEPSDLISPRTHGVSPFIGTSLDTVLRNLGARVLIATGVSVNVGIFGLCVEAVNLGYQVAVPTDAVAGVPREYATSVIEQSLALLATLTTVDELITALGGPP
jgi:nicotinamidase-related amidase